jgi:hypothetical protein
LTSFGFDILISLLLPGSLLLSGVALLVWHYGQSLNLYKWAALAASSDAVLGGAVLLASAVLGGMLAAVLEVIEWKCMDRQAAKALEIGNDLYDEEWYCYVEGLNQSGNRYLSWKARFFMFQLRSGAALGLLAISWVVALPSGGERWLGASCLLLASVTMLGLARASHNLLANWRHRMFEKEATSRLSERATAHG